MKKIDVVLTNVMKRACDKSLQRDANSTSCTIIYQPKSPATLKKFSKFAN